ncbi:MAG: glycosyltransferase [Desulfuromonadales bacterium]|nr:glycosyltransferase [Desulfuromonadales bacterium]
MSGSAAGAAKVTASRSGVLWVAWERHRRTLELCRYLGLEPAIFTSTLPRWCKHPWFIGRTVGLLLQQRPRTVIVQNPSVVLTALACLLRPLLRYRLVVDAHNAGVLPDHPLLTRVPSFYRFLQRRADLTVVTNDALAARIRANGGSPLQLPDRLPQPPRVDPPTLKGERNLVFICTFGGDEPYREVLAAARQFDPGIHLYVTGNFHKLPPSEREAIPPQVTLTGYLPEQQYWELLAAADLVLDFTYRDDCLVCGAYEAVAVGTPLLLSDTRALRTYFCQGAIFTDHRPQSIVQNTRLALDRLPQLRRQVALLKEELALTWELEGMKLRTFVEENR